MWRKSSQFSYQFLRVFDVGSPCSLIAHNKKYKDLSHYASHLIPLPPEHNTHITRCAHHGAEHQAPFISSLAPSKQLHLPRQGRRVDLRTRSL